MAGALERGANSHNNSAPKASATPTSGRTAPTPATPDHTHATETAHIILDGELTLIMAGRSTTYRTGERCDVPAGAIHAARMGPAGCRYLIGEK